MSTDQPTLPPDGGTADGLNRLLDELASGREGRTGGVDRGLAATARIVSTQGRLASVPSDLSMDQTWAALMASRIPDEAGRKHGGAALRIAVVPSSARRRPVGVSIRWALAVAALMILGLAVASVYDGLPGIGSTPTALASGASDDRSPTPTAVPRACAGATVTMTASHPTWAAATTAAGETVIACAGAEDVTAHE